MTWTFSKPKVVGWYWYKGKFSDKVSIRQVREREMRKYGDNKTLLDQFNGVWSDKPIPQPNM